MSKPARPGARQMSPARRHFLHRAIALTGAVGAVAVRPGLAAPLVAPPADPTRTLRFVHTHTGEALTATYFDGTDYSAECLQDINRLMRDFRTGDTHPMDPPLLDILYDLQALADRDAPFEIISAYRSPTTNAMLHHNSSGVAEHSQHLLGKAIDVRLSGYSTQRLSEYARTLARGGVGFYASSDFVHVDTGPVRHW